MSKTQSVLQLVKGQDQYIKQLPLEDGRLSFAVDSKKIYMDCDFEDLHGMNFQNRISFGGNSGIYYGNRTFSVDEIEQSSFLFYFPGDFNGDSNELPTIDDIIINSDGCFYRIIGIENNQITTNKLTVAGSGGGGGGLTSGIVVARDPHQNYNIIAANKSIPIGFKVIDSLPDTTIDVEVYINDVFAGNVRNVTQGEFTSIDAQRWASYFTINQDNTVLLRFTNEYLHAAQLKIPGIRLVALEVRIPSNLGVVTNTRVNLNIEPYGASNMAERFLNIRVNVPRDLNPKTFKIPFSETIDNGEAYVYTVLATEGIEGTYVVDVWLSAIAHAGDTEELQSPSVSTSFIYRSSSSHTPMLSVNLGQSHFEQYAIAEVEYLIAYEGISATVHLTAECDGEIVADQYQSATFNDPHIWSINLNKAGTYRFNIVVEGYSNLEEHIENIIVDPRQISLPEIDLTDNSLQLYLDAKNRSNNELNPATWTYEHIECEFENFNWNSNGWYTDPETHATSLHLTNGAKMTVPFAIFSMDNTNNTGAQITGKTIEINYSIHNVRDVNNIIINGASIRNNKIEVGIIGVGDKICMNTATLKSYRTPEEDALLDDSERAATNGLRAYIAEDVRVHVAFAIEPIKDYPTADGGTIRYGLIYTYMNGVLSGLTKYTNRLLDAALDAPSYLIFDSASADIDIYSIRVYSKYCQDSILLNNYAADLPDIDARLFTKVNNDVLNNGAISLQRVKDLGNIPYLVVTDLRKTGDKKGNLLDNDKNVVGYGPELGSSSALTIGKKDFRWCPCYYVDPLHPERNFGDPNNLVEAVMYGQGTSSLAYPVKNFRLRFCESGPAYSLLPAIPAKTAEEKAKWENVPPVRIFTFKADYMDSSMAHNIGTGNLLASLYDSIHLKTAAQEHWPDKTLSTNIIGAPCICFWRKDEIGSETYIGRYNFNTDKAEHDLFGFTPEEDGFFGRLSTGTDDDKTYVTGFQATTDESAKWNGKKKSDGTFDEKKALWKKTYYTQPNDEALWSGNGARDDGAGMETAFENGPLYEKVEGPRTIQCWEFLNNGVNLCGFREGWTDPIVNGPARAAAMENWIAAFESRYPEYETEYASDKRGFARLINWLHSTDQSYALSQEQYDLITTNPDHLWSDILVEMQPLDALRAELAAMTEGKDQDQIADIENSEEYKAKQAEIVAWSAEHEYHTYLYDLCSKGYATTNPTFDTPVVISDTTYTRDTKEYRLAKFKNEFNSYMNKNYTLFYYIMTETLLMIDSRAKNMMMCSFDLDLDNNTGHWFPIFYDMDTILGVDNSGILRYSYDVADETEQIYNASANYGYYDESNRFHPNPNYSTLWCNVREAFFKDIRDMYNTLRSGKLTLEDLLQSYNINQADAWAEIYDNKDSQYKYIRPLTEATTVTVNGKTVTEIGIDWIHAAQGTRSLHRTHFLEHRFSYLDGKYSKATNGTEDIFMRANGPKSGKNIHPNPHSASFDFVSPSTQYVVNKFGGNGLPVVTKLLPNKITRSLAAPIGSSEDEETYIFNLGDIYDIGDLSDKFLLTFQVKKKTKLRKFKLGNGDSTYRCEKVTTIGGWENMPLLEEIDLQNTKLSSITLDFTNQKYLQKLYAYGSNIAEVKFAPGGNLQHIELPAAISSITIQDNLFYDTLTDNTNLSIEDYSNISTIHIEGCPLVDTYTLMTNIMLQDHTDNGQMTYIRLPDIDWHIPAADINSDICDIQEVQDGLDIINDLKLLQYISNIGYGIDAAGNPVVHRATSNEYFRGTITIDNANYLVNDLALKETYGQMFPNLKIVYTHPSNIVAGYDIIVHNAQGDTVYKNITSGKDNSITLNAVDAIGFNLRQYLENRVDIPSIASDKQYTYHFKGWSYTAPLSSENDIEINDALANGIEMSYNANTDTWVAGSNCPIALQDSDYTDHKLHLFPIFKMNLQIYKVTFMYTEENVYPEVPWTTLNFEYGSHITLPNTLPVIINLDPDNDGDKSKTTTQLLTTYKLGSSNYDEIIVSGEVIVYPVYGEPQYMDRLSNPSISYFDTIEPSITHLIDSSSFIDDDGNEQPISSGIEAIIREDVILEAVCVPKKIHDKYVVSIKNRSPHIKRVYFESGSKIKYIAGNAGFNGSAFSAYGTGDKYSLLPNGNYQIDSNGTYYKSFAGFTENGPNNTLEYIDLGALTQLTMLGGKNDVTNYGINDNESRVFAYCPQLYIKELPNSIKVISPYCFTEDTEVAFTSIPDYIIIIGNNAFQKCTGLTKVNFNPLFTADGTINRLVNTYNSSATLQSQWPIIGAYAFANCTNLKLVSITKNTSEEKEVTFQGVKTIGDFAFYDCPELIMSLSSTTAGLNNNTLTYIGISAFQRCSKLGLTRMPASIVHIGQNAFANLGSLPSFSDLPKTIRYVGQGIFFGDTLAQQNAYNLVWSFPATLNENKSIVEVVNKALQGTKINKLTFNFSSSEFENTSAAETFVDTTYKTLEPWSIAWGDDENHAFGASRVSNTSIPVEISTRLDSRERG